MARLFAPLWTLTPVTGTPVRVTLWDRPLVYGGHTFNPANLLPSTFEERNSLAPAQLEISVHLEGAGLTAADLVAGAHNRARLHIQVMDTLDLAHAPFKEWKGVIAGLQIVNDEVSRTEFLSLMHLLQQQLGDVYAMLCRVREYGDPECGKDIDAAGERHTGTVATVTDGGLFTVSFSEANGYFANGTLEFTTGANAGLPKRTVKQNVGATTVMHEDWPFEVAIGDAVEMVRGCDRQPETCIDRGQFKRFRGEPGIPGEMALRERWPE